MARTCNIAESKVFTSSGDAIFSVKDGIRRGICLQDRVDPLYFLLDPTKAHDFCTKKVSYINPLPFSLSLRSFYSDFGKQKSFLSGGFPLPPAGRAWQS